MASVVYIFVDQILTFYSWIIILQVVMSWLVAFDVVNIRNRFVSMLWEAGEWLTEPLLRPIRRFLPAGARIDLSPMILLFAIYFLQTLLFSMIQPPC